jgi:hypothetical protein
VVGVILDRVIVELAVFRAFGAGLDGTNDCPIILILAIFWSNPLIVPTQSNRPRLTMRNR